MREPTDGRPPSGLARMRDNVTDDTGANSRRLAAVLHPPSPDLRALQRPGGALVETAADYKCQLLVFLEYFTVQLLTLGNLKRPMREQIRELARQVPRFID